MELPPLVIYMELTHLGSETSKYNIINKTLNKELNYC